MDVYKEEKIFIKEEMEEEFPQDPLEYENEKMQQSSDNESVVEKPSEAFENPSSRKDIEEIMIKEEIKQEIQDDSPYPIENVEAHLSDTENPVAESCDEEASQNCNQVKCPPSNNKELTSSESNSEGLECDQQENANSEPEAVKKSSKSTPGSHRARGPKNLDKQSNISPGETPFKCKFCPYEGRQRSNLQKHLRTHTGEKPFKCTSCSYQAREKFYLQRHLRTHTNEKPFKCTFCSYQAREKINLQRHLRTHTGEKPFNCTSCSYQARERSSLQKHLRTHTGEKPFKCGVCPYEATQRSNLQKHLRIHSDEKPFKCTLCPYQARQRSCLQKHSRVHSGWRGSTYKGNPLLPQFVDHILPSAGLNPDVGNFE